MSRYGDMIFVLSSLHYTGYFHVLCIETVAFTSRFRFGKNSPSGKGESCCSSLPSEWKQFTNLGAVNTKICATGSQNDLVPFIKQVHLSHTRSIMPRISSVLHGVDYLSNPLTLQLHLLVMGPPLDKSLLFQLPRVVGLCQLYHMKRRNSTPPLHHSLHLLITNSLSKIQVVLFKRQSNNNLLVVAPLEIFGSFSFL